MRNYSRKHLSDSALTHQLDLNTAATNEKIAEQIADLAEFDDRKLFRDSGYPSMSQYCRSHLGLSKQTAFKRIRVARLAVEYPAILPAIADGSLNLCSLIILSGHLSPENATELLAAAREKSESEIELLIAERFPKPDVPSRIDAPAPAFELPTAEGNQESSPELSARRVVPTAKMTPLAPERFGLQCTIDKETHDLLLQAQALIGEAAPAAQVPNVVKRSLKLLVLDLQKKKCGMTSKPRQQRRPSRDPRHVSNAVRSAVWLRDQGRCTFVSESGRQCECRSNLQFDHIIPVAKGGEAKVSNIRLRCPAHNQLEAERVFGSEFMKHKREAGRAKQPVSLEPQLGPAAAEVVPWLRGLGFRIAEANAAAAICENMESEPIEKRVRVALSYFKRSSPLAAAGMA